MSFGHLSPLMTVFQGAIASIPSYFPSGQWLDSLCSLPHDLGRQALFQRLKQLTQCNSRSSNAVPLNVIFELRVSAGKQSWWRIAIQMGKWSDYNSSILCWVRCHKTYCSSAWRKLECVCSWRRAFGLLHSTTSVTWGKATYLILKGNEEGKASLRSPPVEDCEMRVRAPSCRCNPEVEFFWPWLFYNLEKVLWVTLAI